MIAFFMGIARARDDEWIGELIRAAHSQTWSEPEDPQVGVFGGPYDHEAKGDFE